VASRQAHFVGEVPSRTIGAEVMKELTAGNADALRMVGVEPPPGFDPRANEWGLAQLKDGRVVLVRGGAGEVDWSQLPPDLTPLAHTHPFRDPVTGAERLLTGVDTGSGKPYSIDAKALFTKDGALHQDQVFFLPSTSDLAHVTANGIPHTVYTPYIHLGGGRIGKRCSRRRWTRSTSAASTLSWDALRVSFCLARNRTT
jgi:hypothetical protein